MANASSESVRIVTPEFVVSFPHLKEPHAFKEGDPARYMVTMLFPKEDEEALEGMKDVAHVALAGLFGDNPDKWPRKLWNPFRDGDAEYPDTEGFPGRIFVAAKSTRPPQLLLQRPDGSRVYTQDTEEFYAGSICKASVTAFAFDQQTKGVGFWLNAIMKIRDGERIGHSYNAEDDFGEVEDEMSPTHDEQEDESAGAKGKARKSSRRAF